jgi:ATP-dependent Zn protease
VIDTEIKAILDSQYEVAKGILTKHKKALDQGATLVLKEETIDGERLKQLLPKRTMTENNPNKGVMEQRKTSRTRKP